MEDRADLISAELLEWIRLRAGQVDRTGQWPQEELDALAAVGAMRWGVPKSFGGEELSPLDLHLRYETIASSSAAVALILTQRDSALGLLVAGENEDLRRELLPALARNEFFATVGIAQLTTSRQSGLPAVRATAVEGGYRLNGVVPWASGAGKAKFVVVGAILDDGRQILVALPMSTAGILISPPAALVSLKATWTSSIECKSVSVDSRWVIRGPIEKVLADRKNHLPLGQCFLATGLCRGALDLIREHDSAAARSAIERFEIQLNDVRQHVIDLSAPGREADAVAASPQVRGACNDLAVRITHAAVALYKGTGLLDDHPAQRLAREAMFLLVWSCPNSVIDCTVDLLSGRPA